MESLGVPQRRKRHFLISSRADAVDAAEVVHAIEESLQPARTVRWAIADLHGSSAKLGSSGFDAPSVMSEENKRRIALLFKKGLYRLPDEERPVCHRDGQHSYRSVYGRMRWDEPAQTITTGYSSMGQGCFVHPAARRTITPHEAARLQTFPDFFRFDTVIHSRTAWARSIGNAVPPLAMRAICRDVVRQVSQARARRSKVLSDS
ncbi:MAG: hypothetical protein DHS20C15_11130 [Planctomycetota bacterium]|nr:MAG: hypothetical protein DHS20C15_11130 [Planctomycetota bacterium]